MDSSEEKNALEIIKQKDRAMLKQNYALEINREELQQGFENYQNVLNPPQCDTSKPGCLKQVTFLALETISQKFPEI